MAVHDRGLASEDRGDCFLEPLPFAAIRPEDRDDRAAPRDRERHADPGAGAWAAIPWGGTSQQLVDPARHRLEIVLVDPGFVRRRIRVGPGKDRGKSVRRIRVQPIAHRQAPQSGRGPAVGRHGTEQLIDGCASRGDIPRDDVAFGGPVALARRKRGHLRPQQEPPTELGISFRFEPLPDDLGGAVLPDCPADSRVQGQEEDEPVASGGRDVARLELEREDGREVQPTGGQRSVGRVGQSFEVLRVDALAEGILAEIARCPCAETGDGGVEVAGARADVGVQEREPNARRKLVLVSEFLRDPATTSSRSGKTTVMTLRATSSPTR